MVGVKPGTWQEPTITETDQDVRVLVRGVTVAKLVQLRSKRWVVAVRGAALQPAGSWRYREEAIEGLREMFADGVPEEYSGTQAVPQ
ncbi:MAG: hypothetical protein JWQ74_1080 [Marmoricola sp.]|nr:hypothetical protein [Marmoricola sp.]